MLIRARRFNDFRFSSCGFKPQSSSLTHAISSDIEKRHYVSIFWKWRCHFALKGTFMMLLFARYWLFQESILLTLRTLLFIIFIIYIIPCHICLWWCHYYSSTMIGTRKTMIVNHHAMSMITTTSTTLETKWEEIWKFWERKWCIWHQH